MQPGDEQRVAEAFDAGVDDLGLSQGTIIITPLSADGLCLSVMAPVVSARARIPVPAPRLIGP